MNITPPIFPASILSVIREVNANPPAGSQPTLTVEYKEFPGDYHHRTPGGESCLVSFYFETYRAKLIFSAFDREDESPWWEVRLGYKTLASSGQRTDPQTILPEVTRLLALLKKDNEVQAELKAIRG